MNRSEFVTYVDFDTTLYDTKLFAVALFRVIASTAHTSPDLVASNVKQFTFDPLLGGYDYAAHIASFGLDPEHMWQQLDLLLKRHNYLYDDSVTFVQAARQRGYDPHILTFGEERFQLAKITPLLHTLSGDGQELVPVTVVDRRKRLHIQDTNAGQSGVLIDDVPNQALPLGFTEIHIDRTRLLAQPASKPGGYTVSNLAQALQCMEELTGPQPLGSPC